MSGDTTLRREVGLGEAVVYGVGIILGAGIYAILGEAAGVTGGSVVLSFLLAAVVATFTGLSYAELASMYPKGEGDYVYVREAFSNKPLSEFTALCRLLVGAVSAAAVALAFAGYLTAFVDAPTTLTAAALVVVLAAVNFWGIDFSTKVNVAFTAVEVLGLLLVVWAGAPNWGRVDPLQMPGGGLGVLEATFLLFFAYLGFGSIVNLAEETADATRTIPRAILVSIGVTTVLYVLVALSAVGTVDPRVLGASPSPLADVARAAWGSDAGVVLAAVALFSTTNTVLIVQVSTSRLLYGVSKTEYRSFPPVFSRVHPGRGTPHYAVAAVALVTLPFVLLGDVGAVAAVANLLLLVVFFLANAALLALRYRRPDAERPFRAPLNTGRLSVTALGGAASSVALVALYVLGL